MTTKHEELQKEVYELTALVHSLSADVQDKDKLIIELQEWHRKEAVELEVQINESVQTKIDNMNKAAVETKALYEADLVKVTQQYEEKLITMEIRERSLINRLAEYKD